MAMHYFLLSHSLRARCGNRLMLLAHFFTDAVRVVEFPEKQAAVDFRSAN